MLIGLSAECKGSIKLATYSVLNFPDHLCLRSSGFRMIYALSTSTYVIVSNPLICSFLIENSVPYRETLAL